MILLTGAAGVVGSALLEALPADDVVCLAHTADPGAGAAEVVRGDVTAADLGLDASAYRELVDRVDYVVHSAAVTDFMQPPDLIARVNVGGTENVLAFAERAGAPVLYVSTAFTYRAPGIAASDDSDDPSAVTRGIAAYLRSKREAEERVRAAQVGAVIARPSIVIGDSRTGATRKYQGLQVLTGLAATGRLPILPGSAEDTIDFLPQDYVARVLAAFVAGRVAEGEPWITAGPAAITLADAIAVAEEHAESVGRPIDRPGVISDDLMERLVRPVFYPELPDDVTSQLDTLFRAAALGIRPYRFPTDLPALRERFGLPEPPDLRGCLLVGTGQWARDAALARRRHRETAT
jgi:nucleoside-diphosphate-sugar epimerase